MHKTSFIQFPDVTSADENGLLAMGGDLSSNTLLSAYAQGIFPWFTEQQPILWWSPDPRMVLFPNKIKISRSLQKVIKKQQFEVRCNSDFVSVIQGCALRGLDSPAAEAETWITDSMQQAYIELHNQGYAHAIEVWQKDKLVGGLYGIALSKVFFGESMFSEVSNASKVALVALCQWLQQKQFQVIDCQICSPHLVSMGAEEIPRQTFIGFLQDIQIEQRSCADFNDFSTFK